MNSTLTYLDNNATTRPAPAVVAALLPLLTELWGNPSSAHHFGAQVGALVEEARQEVAAVLHARESEIIFTSGGTEADNAALRGVLAADPRRRHVVVSAVEHHAILDLTDRLVDEGCTVTRVPVDAAGRLDLGALEEALRDDTALVSIMLVNNETGVIAPVAEVCALAHARRIPVHTDAVNALGKVPIEVESLGVDLLSLSGHKIHGPKGVGALYVRRGTPFRPWLLGGSQERKRRGGTLNAPGIVGFGVACRLVRTDAPAAWPRLAALRDRLEAGLRHIYPPIHLAGADAPRVANTTCACFAGLPAEALIILLSEANICVSSGAACASGSLEPSHVLQAMGTPPEIAQGQIRFSLGRESTDDDIDRVLAVLPGVLAKATTCSAVP